MEDAMTIALIDDCPQDLALLSEYVCRYCNEHKIHVAIKQFSQEKDFENTLGTERYDLVFLDIFMPDSGGILIAKKLKRSNPKCQIIFSTSSKEHAVKAFRLHALDYLLKPYTYAQLEDALNRFEKTVKKFAHYIELKEGYFMTRIPIADIMYVDYHNHYIQVHTPLKIIRSYMFFNSFSPMLSPYRQFLWCYRNCLVNMDYIDTWEGNDFILKNGERLLISKPQKREIIQAYANYIFDYVNGGTVS